MEALNVSLFVALSAGALSFASPCVVPLVPAYLGYLSGTALTSGDQSTPPRWTTFLHSLAFVVGFSIVFIQYVQRPSNISLSARRYGIIHLRGSGYRNWDCSLVLSAMKPHLVGMVRLLLQVGILRQVLHGGAVLVYHQG